MPASRTASTTAFVPASSTPRPKRMQPSRRRLPRAPELAHAHTATVSTWARRSSSGPSASPRVLRRLGLVEKLGLHRRRIYAAAGHHLAQVGAVHELLRGLARVEVVLHDDHVRVVRRAPHAIRADTAVALHFPDAVVDLPPGLVVADPVVDEQRGHTRAPSSSTTGAS